MDKKDFKPHMMYDPKTGKGYMAKTYGSPQDGQDGLYSRQTRDERVSCKIWNLGKILPKQSIRNVLIPLRLFEVESLVLR